MRVRGRAGTVALLLLGAVAVLYNVRTYSQLFAQPKPSSMPSATSEKPERRSTPEPSADEAVVPQSRAAVESFVGALPASQRDPFRFATSGGPHGDGAGPGSLTVQGILIGATRRVVWINGRARSEGEEVDGHVLKRIEPDRVIVTRDGQETEVRPQR